MLSWRTLARLVRGGAVKHRVGPAPTTVYWTTGLRINENLIGSFGGGQSTTVLNDRKARLKLVCHLL
tara:strand:+ start:251 stop:451 length:201 start_codon:yes stop_codon:yes gene_type:complete